MRQNQTANIYIMGVPGGKEREKGLENVLEDIVAESFPNLGKETDIQIQEAQRLPNRINSKGKTPIHIIIKMAKNKDKEPVSPRGNEP